MRHGGDALASILSYYTRKITFNGLPVLSAFFPVLFNAIIVGLEISILAPEGFAFAAFLIAALEVAVGELVMCYGLGLPLYGALKKTGADKFLK